MSRMKIFLLTLFLSGAPSLLFAERRPPETMCEGEVCGSSLEIPVHSVLAAGGVTTSTPTYRDRGHFLSQSLGEPFSGKMEGEDLHLEIGHGFFEFYSDRIPMYNVSLTVNGGLPLTNNTTFFLGIQFKDDLSGFKSSSVTQQGGEGRTQVLNVDADNFYEWWLGDVPDGSYKFGFQFEDRAGNVTVTPATASVTLDRVPPPFGSIVINKGNTITATPVVNLDLRANDDRTGISFVRLANSTSAVGVEFPFISPKMSIEWQLDSSSGGLKTVYARYRDGAGNWQENVSSDSITLDQFEPHGDFTFLADGNNVVEISPGVFQTKILTVPLQFSWDPSVIGILESVEISGGPINDKFTVPSGVAQVPHAYKLGSDDAPDGVYELSAVFIDLDGKESAPVKKRITLNRDSPEDPTFVGRKIYTSSLTIVSQITHTDKKLSKYVITPVTYDFGASSDSWNLNYSTEPVTFTDYDLRPNTKYSYVIRAFDEIGAGSIRGLNVEATTEAEPPKISTPPAGIEVRVIRVSYGTGNNPAGTKYRLEWSQDPALPEVDWTKGDWSVQNPRDVEGLDRGTTYYFRARARNDDPIEPVTTNFVDLGSTATLSYIQPKVPLSFVAANVTATSVLWRWARNPSTEEGFRIFNGDVEIVNLPFSTTEYLELGLIPNTVVTRSILSYNFLDLPDTRSESKVGTVLIPPAVPAAQNITALGSSIHISWTPNNNPDHNTEYQADIAQNDEFTLSLATGAWIQGHSISFDDLEPQTTYFVRVRARGQELSGQPRLTSDYLRFPATVTRIFSPTGEVDINNGSAWRISIPPNALDQAFGVGMEVNPSNFSIADIGLIQRANDKAYRESNGYRFPIPDGIVEFTLTNSNGDPMNPTFKKQARLTHLYNVSNTGAISPLKSSSENIGLQIPDPANPAQTKHILAKTLRIWILDTKTESWFRLPTNDVDLFLSQVAGGLQRIGIFAVMGAPSTDVSEVVSFPVPWRPSGPNAGSGAGQTGTEADGITFGNIPQEGKIQIIDLQGALVKEINLNGNALEPWDVKNSNGEKVASGTYYWIVESAGNRKTGKLMVIR